MRHLLLLGLLLALFPSLCLASRGISLDIKKAGGGTEQIALYKESHALLIGVSDYTNGWPDLTSIPGEMNALEESLKGQGFNVVKVLNPDSDQLADSYEDFIDRYGFDRENRLLFFFSGHGYSRTEAGKGYIVPTDAPSPLDNERGFVRKAIEMEQIVTWARRIESKHAMFLFDSCFSGTVFQSRALPESPPHISAMVARPVRQFISAGSAGEKVPSRSVFVPSFIRAIEGEGDLDNDGYVTGTELGMYLNRKVAGYQVGQTPQYGKIRDPRLDQGDFVLLPGLTTDNKVATPAKTPKGSLTINSDPYGVELFVDDVRKGTSPLTLDELSEGRLRVRAEKSGYESKEEVVLVRSGRKMELNFQLDKVMTTGAIEVSSTPSGAKWYLDGAYVGTTPDTMRGMEPGAYAVLVKAAGYQDYVEQVRVAKSRTVRLAADLQKISNGETGSSTAKNNLLGSSLGKASDPGVSNLAAGRRFLAENGRKSDVVTLPSGLQYRVIEPGRGRSPGRTSNVTVHYRGTLIDGSEFDSSYKRGQPATFPVLGVIAGWTEALQLMREGSRWELFIPPDLAYGERRAGAAIGPNTTLVFEVEMIKVN